MEVCRRSSWLLLLLGVSLLATALQGVQGEVESEGPSESECRPYIEKALKELETGEAAAEAPDEEAPDEGIAPAAGDDSKEEVPTVEITTDDNDSNRQDDGDGDSDDDTHEDNRDNEQDDNKGSVESIEESAEDDGEKNEALEEEGQSEQEDTQEDESSEGREKRSVDEDTDTKEESGEEEGEATAAASAEDDQKTDGDSGEEPEDQSAPTDSDSKEDEIDSKQSDQEGKSEDGSEEQPEEKSEEESAGDPGAESVEEQASKEDDKPSAEAADDEAGADSKEGDTTEEGASQEVGPGEEESVEGATDDDSDSKEAPAQISQEEDTKEDDTNESEDGNESKEGDNSKEVGGGGESKEESEGGSKEGGDNDTKEDEDDSKARSEEQIQATHVEADEKSVEQADGTPEDADNEAKEVDSKESKEDEEVGVQTESTEKGESAEDEGQSDSKEDDQQSSSDEDAPEEALSLDVEIPTDLRPRQHVEQLLKLDEESSEAEKIINRIAEITLRELKKLYENAIKPLEVLYKYRDLSNRHFGDSEIFSKPLILFMGPWSGGKSSIINYLLDNEYNETSLRTGAEPSPAYFNILMYGEEPEVVDGTQLAADFTFSGLQKFGQGLEERLRGVKLPNKLLEKVNIVEIPGILEVRKQVSRVFPFNDACQWFIDRADIIFLVYDPSKLDVGPETEAILDQLKGREHQTRIILNKADQVKPEELMRVQGALIWNISPLMSSAQPPVMYTTSLWSRPYEPWAPVKLLQAQERAFLRDLRTAVDKRIENKIASARRFAVRVRNHAKMVDCYLTTYYNHKSLFGNRKQVADAIIEHPQNYHIYEGLSTLTNISRYDLPDPEVYRDFFKLNPLYEFQQLSATCTYFRGCPINRLDIAIAYDLPELVGKHRRMVEAALTEANQQQKPVPGS